MYSQLQRSATTSISGSADLIARAVLLHDAFGIVVARRERILVRGDSEEQHAAYSEAVEFARFGDRAVARQPRDAGHRADRPRIFVALRDEERSDQLFDRDAMFANERAHDVAAAQAAGRMAITACLRGAP